MKTFFVLSRTILLGAAISMTAALNASAVVDTLDTTNNFFSNFNGTTATANGDGTVTLTRNTANVDAGIDWRNAGVNLSLATENVITITPVAPVNGGFWNVDLLFFNSGSFVNETNWVADTQSTLAVTTNAALLAGVGANEYFVRFRIQPFDQSNVGYQFTEISAVPEPRTLMLVGVAFVLLVGCLRRV